MKSRLYAHRFFQPASCATHNGPRFSALLFTAYGCRLEDAMKSKLDEMARRTDVSIAAKGLMVILASFFKRRQCRPTRQQLIECSGMAANTLYARLGELRAANLLNMIETRDDKGRIRTMFILFPPIPNGAAPCRNLWGKGLVANPATRKPDFTHARAR